VVVAGGDGTVNEAVRALGGSGVPLGIIPLGTANVLARELRIPKKPERAIEAAFGSAQRVIDLGRVRFRRSGESCLFACMMGAGFDAFVARIYGEARGTTSHLYSYAPTILTALMDFPLQPITVSVDGEEAPSAGTVIVSNTSTYGGPFRPSPNALPDDGALDICLLRMRTRREMAVALAVGLIGRQPTRIVESFRGRNIVLRSDGDVPVQVDGDFVGFLPVEVSVLPRSLSVFVPE